MWDEGLLIAVCVCVFCTKEQGRLVSTSVYVCTARRNQVVSSRVQGLCLVQNNIALMGGM